MVTEYPQVRAFPGVIGWPADESTPAWPGPGEMTTDDEAETDRLMAQQ